MKRLTLIICALVGTLGACGDNTPSTPPGDAGIDSPGATSGPCIERPTDLPRPSATLPCELLPPGFKPPESS